MAEDRALLTATSLGRRRAGRDVVSDLSFVVRAGETVGLLGPNGAGKTTTLHLLAGRLAPSSGSASIAGFDVVAAPLEARARVGYAPAELPRDPDRTARELLVYAATLRGARSPSEAASEALAELDLRDHADARVDTLSTGARRRLGLALATIHRPPVLLLDEPAAGLDPDQRTAVRSLLRDRVAAGAAVVLSTHLLEDAEALCDRVLVLRGGRLAVSAAPRHALELALAGPADVPALLAAVEGAAATALGGDRWRVESPRDVRAEVAAALAGAGLLELRAVGDVEATYRGAGDE